MQKDSQMIQRLNELVVGLNVNQAQFAEATGIAKGNLSQILNGKRTCGIAIINRIRLAYPEVSIHWLMDGEGEMFIKRPLQDVADSHIDSETLAEGFSKSFEKSATDLYASNIAPTKTVETEKEDKYLSIIKKQQSQIDRLLTLLERNNIC